ncbi:MAG: hypothetical protein IKS20_09855 [Victivallales bacterium]|nr:hypothetical protein [Victivallales bacterium]
MKKMIFACLLAVAMIGFAQDGGAEKPKAKGGKPAREMKGNRPQGQAHGGRNMLADVKEVHAKVMAKYDKDQDGKLDDAEKAAVEADLNMNELQEKMRMARAWNMFKRLDKNQDGELSEEELKGMKNMRPAGGREGGPRKNGGDKPQRKKPEAQN